MNGPGRLALALVCGFLIAAVCVGLVGLIRPGSHPTAIAAQLRGTEIWPAGAHRAYPFALRDQNGRTVTPRTLRRHVWAITFLDSNCRQLCPTEARDLARVQRLLGPRNPLSVVIVSVLPQYDTPKRVTAFARTAGLTGDWHWLLGAQSELRPVWRKYSIAVLSGQEHTAALYLVDRSGYIRIADAIPFLSQELAGSVKALSATST